MQHECPKRVVPCTLDCGFSVRFEQLTTHLAHDCKRRKLTCRHEDCGHQLMAMRMQRHEEQECSYRWAVNRLYC
jgi:hypothetical protein